MNLLSLVSIPRTNKKKETSRIEIQKGYRKHCFSSKSIDEFGMESFCNTMQSNSIQLIRNESECNSFFHSISHSVSSPVYTLRRDQQQSSISRPAFHSSPQNGEEKSAQTNQMEECWKVFRALDQYLFPSYSLC